MEPIPLIPRGAGTRRAWAALVGLVLTFLVAGCGQSAGSPAVHVRIHHSRFVPAVLTVAHGAPTTFLLVNDDPIDHEWIVGSDAVHRAHRTGTEPVHDSRATEISVPALGSRTTTITFAERGTLAFVCHLPGHEAYGMVGTLNVR